MKNQTYKFNTKGIWLLLIGNIFLIFIGTIASLQQSTYSEILLISGILLYFIAWIIILIDMMKSKIENRTIWIASLFVLPYLACIIYAIQRDDIIQSNENLV